MSLERSKLEGSLGLPNFLHNYWSANISKLTYWITTFADKEGPLWSTMELQSSLPVSPISSLASPLPLNLKNHKINPVVLLCSDYVVLHLHVDIVAWLGRPATRRCCWLSSVEDEIGRRV